MRHAVVFIAIAVVSSISVVGQRPAADYNPRPFQGAVVSPSSTVRFLGSARGRIFLHSVNTDRARELLKLLGDGAGDNPIAPGAGDFSGHATVAETVAATPPVAVCDGVLGSVFNLEPAKGALPQNEESLDFIYNGAGPGADLIVEGANDYRGFFNQFGGSITGYYIRRSAAGCGPQAEGGLPTIKDPLSKIPMTLPGSGDPVVAADAGRQAFFMADLRFDQNTTGIGVFRTTAANLLNPTTCPAGTHTGAQAAVCWPASIVANPQKGALQFTFVDKPHLAVDDRATGVGAGTVYVTGTEFDHLDGSDGGTISRIFLVACANDLSACTTPLYISDPDKITQFSHVAVRPDGKITVTWINVVLPDPNNFFPQYFAIRYAICTPAAPSPSALVSAPACSAPKTIFTDQQPIPFGGFLATEDLRIATYPKHDHRVSSGTTQTFVAWDRCNAPPFLGAVCVSSSIMMISSNDDGATWSAPVRLSSAPGHQFFPWLKADRSNGTINISYYATDPTDYYGHRLFLLMNQIAPASNTPGSAIPVTTTLDDPAADPILGGFFLGDYIGLAARGTSALGQSHAYVGFTYNARFGSYSGMPSPQQDNYVGLITY